MFIVCANLDTEDLAKPLAHLNRTRQYRLHCVAGSD